MINTPVKRHQMFTSSFVDKFGCFLDDAQMNDAQKRINMHDELVSAMRNMFDMLSINCQCNSYSREQLKKYLEAEKLLERCK